MKKEDIETCLSEIFRYSHTYTRDTCVYGCDRIGVSSEVGDDGDYVTTEKNLEDEAIRAHMGEETYYTLFLEDMAYEHTKALARHALEKLRRLK